jgi:dTDP-glucose 4,6-dehydratase
MKKTWGLRAVLVAWDWGSWIIALPLALFLRFEFNPPEDLLYWSLIASIFLGFIHILIGIIFFLYRGRYVVGSFDEVLGVIVLTFFVGLSGSIFNILIPFFTLPRSTFIIATGIATASMLGIRFLWRANKRKLALGRNGKRVLIYGAGKAGSQIVNLMLNDNNNSYQPIGFIDDNVDKHHLILSGIKVLGDSSELESICFENHVDTLLVAIANISAPALLELDQRLRSQGIQVTVIPTASEIVGGAIKLGDISDVTEEDLMGRRPITTNEEEITQFCIDKRILVTGAGGSIGSEMSRQISRYNPRELFLLDRDESALHKVQLSLDGSGHLMSSNLILADIRDSDRMNQIIANYKPEIIFHSAALKHLPLLERHPEEAFKTNILGTINVLQAAINNGVKNFVNISTDKAADPISILGKSKLITEQLTAAAPAISDRNFVSVRFGNVLGSRGSVVETFRFQIEKGGPVTVTDKAVSRYFMTIREAVHLVLQAAVIGSHGETLILDMGSPVRIYDLAKQMIDRSGRKINIEITGLRPGEKMDEILISSNERPEPTSHDMITRIRVTPLQLPGPKSLDEVGW